MVPGVAHRIAVRQEIGSGGSDYETQQSEICVDDGLRPSADRVSDRVRHGRCQSPGATGGRLDASRVARGKRRCRRRRVASVSHSPAGGRGRPAGRRGARVARRLSRAGGAATGWGGSATDRVSLKGAARSGPQGLRRMGADVGGAWRADLVGRGRGGSVHRHGPCRRRQSICHPTRLDPMGA